MGFTARFSCMKIILCTMVLVPISAMFLPRAVHGEEPAGDQPKAVDAKTNAFILPPGGTGAATNLRVETYCDKVDPRKGIARLHWTVAEERGREQRVEVTIYRRGFEKDLFESSKPLPADQASLTWDQVKGQAIHHWRVLTRQAKGWVPSETSKFEGPPCVADFLDCQEK